MVNSSAKGIVETREKRRTERERGRYAALQQSITGKSSSGIIYDPVLATVPINSSFPRF